MKRLRKAEEGEVVPSVAAVILKALEKGKIEKIMPVLPAVEREVALWHTRQHSISNKRWELLYLLLGLLFGGGTGASLVKWGGKKAEAVEEVVTKK